MKGPAAGTLDQRVTLQSYTATRSDMGAEVRTWADVATVWAAVEPLSSRELLSARQELAGISTRIRIRYRAGVTAAMRVLHGATVYRIDGTPIDEGSRHEHLVLMCSAEDVAT